MPKSTRIARNLVSRTICTMSQIRYSPGDPMLGMQPEQTAIAKRTQHLHCRTCELESYHRDRQPSNERRGTMQAAEEARIPGTFHMRGLASRRQPRAMASMYRRHPPISCRQETVDSETYPSICVGCVRAYAAERSLSAKDTSPGATHSHCRGREAQQKR